MRQIPLTAIAIAVFGLLSAPVHGQNAVANVTITVPVPIRPQLANQIQVALAKALASAPLRDADTPRVVPGEIAIPRTDAGSITVVGADNPWAHDWSNDGGRVLQRGALAAVIQAQGGPAEVNSDELVTLDELTVELDKAVAEEEEFEGALLTRSLVHAKRNRLDLALSDLNQLITLNPRKTEFLLLRANSYRHLNRVEDAERDLTRSIELQPRSIFALAERSECLIARLEFEGALRDLNTCLLVDPMRPEALARRADVKCSLKQYDSALDDCRQALTVSPDHLQALVARGRVYWNLDKPERALADFNLAIALAPKAPGQLYLDRALIHWKLNNRSDALRDSNEAIRLGECETKAHLMRAEIRMVANDKAGARADLLDAARIADIGVGMTIYLAGKLAEVEEHEQAKVVYKRAASLPATDFADYVARAQAREQSGLIALAIEDYTAALKLEPENIENRLRRAILYFAVQNWESALGEFDKLIDQVPNKGPLLRLRGGCWQARSELDKALTDYTRAIELDPSDPESLTARAHIRRAQGKYSQAIDDLAAAIRADENCFGAYRLLASIWASCPEKEFRVGEAAVGAATRLMENPKRDALDYVLLAVAHAECGNFEDAIKYQTEALGRKPDDRQFQAGERARLELYRSGQPYHEPARTGYPTP